MEFYFSFFLIINLPPIKAIGIYATNKSKIVNHIGEGTKNTIKIPPIKKINPTIKASCNLYDVAINAAKKAPINVPKACAKNGKIKCFGSNNGNACLKPASIVTSITVLN